MKGISTGWRSRRLTKVVIASCAAAVMGGAFFAVQAEAQNVTVKPTPGRPWLKNVMFLQSKDMKCFRLAYRTLGDMVPGKKPPSSAPLYSGIQTSSSWVKVSPWFDTYGSLGWRSTGIKIREGDYVGFSIYNTECREAVFGKGPDAHPVRSGFVKVRTNNLQNIWIDPYAVPNIPGLRIGD